MIEQEIKVSMYTLPLPQSAQAGMRFQIDLLYPKSHAHSSISNISGWELLMIGTVIPKTDQYRSDTTTPINQSLTTANV